MWSPCRSSDKKEGESSKAADEKKEEEDKKEDEEKKDESPKKKELPKWMVQDADEAVPEEEKKVLHSSGTRVPRPWVPLPRYH